MKVQTAFKQKHRSHVSGWELRISAESVWEILLRVLQRKGFAGAGAGYGERALRAVLSWEERNRVRLRNLRICCKRERERAALRTLLGWHGRNRVRFGYFL